jgi:hypothetical protein
VGHSGVVESLDRRTAGGRERDVRLARLATGRHRSEPERRPGGARADDLAEIHQSLPAEWDENGIVERAVATWSRHRKGRVSRARRTLRYVIDNRCGLIDPANPCRCGRQIASGEAAGVIDRTRLPLARHPRQGTHVWIEPVAKQLDTVAAIGDLYRFAAPAELWDDLQACFPDLLTTA